MAGKITEKCESVTRTYVDSLLGIATNYVQIPVRTHKKILLPRKIALIIRQRDKIIALEVASIAVFLIKNGFTFAYTFSQEKNIVDENLEELESTFFPAFFRANQQHLVSRKAIKDANHFFNRKIIINLTVPF